MASRYFLPFLLTVLSIPQIAWGGMSNLCRIHYPSDAQVNWKCYRIRPGETLEGLFGEAWQDVARFNRIDRRHVRPGLRVKAPLDVAEVKDFTAMAQEYPAAASEAKFILVDLSEQFLGGYEFGRLVFSTPITSGNRGKHLQTPTGRFRITAYHRQHTSSLYPIEGTDIPYPMHYALMFHVNSNGVAFWIHGRDVPGYPASHGCIGLYDEQMQKAYYGYPSEPILEDARILYEWVISPFPDVGRFRLLPDGPRVLIVGKTPIP